MTNDREQRIRDRAYALWEQEGGGHGRHEEHWARATGEIDGPAHPSSAKPTAASKSRLTAKPKAEKAAGAKPSTAKAAPVQVKTATAKVTLKPAGRANRKSS
jgi:hypothetical protein